MKLDARPSALLVFGLLAALKAAALVGIAQAVATGIVSAIAGKDAWRGAPPPGLGRGALPSPAPAASSRRRVAGFRVGGPSISVGPTNTWDPAVEGGAASALDGPEFRST